MALKKLAVWADRAYQSDALLDPLNPVNRDNCLSAFHLLAGRLSENGWEVHTHDVYRSSNTVPEALLFLDIPRASVDSLLGAWRGKTKKFVVLQECEVIKPGNWELGAHSQFDALFTWSDRLVDEKRYFKVNFANHFPGSLTFDVKRKEKLCVMITANKKRHHPLQLYSSREEAVRWFELNHPRDFDLYGAGWDSYVFDGPRPLRALNRLKPLTRILAPHYPSYKGRVAVKRDVMEKYRFSICYENAREIPGYITEKIFDSFLAGCVPIYWGAPDVAEHIPENCFIDRRKFGSYEELYAFITDLSAAGYLAMLESIRSFIASPAAYQFSDERFADVISKVVADVR